MKIWAWGAVVASTIAVVACGNGGTTTTTTTGSGGSTTGTTTMHVSSSSHTSTGVTTGTGGSGGGAGACGSLKYTSVAACEAVVETNCCDELSACDAGTACDGFLSCANTCQGTAMTCDATCKTCVQACETSQASGFTDFQTLQTCYDQKCAAQMGCGTPICMSGVLEANADCGTCLGGDATCCAAFTACAADMACGACFATPTSAACKANTSFQAVQKCQNGATCGAKCADAICDSGLHYPNNAACNYCLGNTDAMNGCCEEMDACVADATCKGCLTGTISGAMCTSNMPYTKFNTCSTAKCATACGG